MPHGAPADGEGEGSDDRGVLGPQQLSIDQHPAGQRHEAGHEGDSAGRFRVPGPGEFVETGVDPAGAVRIRDHPMVTIDSFAPRPVIACSEILEDALGVHLGVRPAEAVEPGESRCTGTAVRLE